MRKKSTVISRERRSADLSEKSRNGRAATFIINRNVPGPANKQKNNNRKTEERSQNIRRKEHSPAQCNGHLSSSTPLTRRNAKLFVGRSSVAGSRNPQQECLNRQTKRVSIATLISIDMTRMKVKQYKRERKTQRNIQSTA